MEEGKKIYLHMLPFFHFKETFPEKEQWNLSLYAETQLGNISQVFSYECLKKSIGHPQIFEK